LKLENLQQSQKKGGEEEKEKDLKDCKVNEDSTLIFKNTII